MTMNVKSTTLTALRAIALPALQATIRANHAMHCSHGNCPGLTFNDRIFDIW